MKKNLYFFVLLLPLFYLGCGENEDPDLRESFVGTFVLDDYDVTLIIEGFDTSTVSILANSEIEIDIETDSTFDADELEADFVEFVEEAMPTTLTAVLGDLGPMSIEFDDIGKIEIDSRNEFKFEDLDFRIFINGIPYFCEIGGKGVIQDDQLTLEFEMILYAGSLRYIFSGTVTGEREAEN